MTDRSKQEIAGSLYLERRTLESEIGLLTGKARQVGEKLISLGIALRDNPSLVRFDYQDVEHRIVPLETPSYTAYLPSESELKSLTSELREKISRLENVKRELT